MVGICLCYTVERTLVATISKVEVLRPSDPRPGRRSVARASLEPIDWRGCALDPNLIALTLGQHVSAEFRDYEKM